jgi:hypothetical protein
MLTYRQIQKLAHPYTDYRIGARAHKSKVKAGNGWWSNGWVAFREDLPAQAAKKATVKELTAEDAEELASQATGARVELEPVEIRPVESRRAYRGEYRIVRMQNGCFHGWVDGKYLAAVMRRFRNEIVTWMAVELGIAAVVDGEVQAVIAPFDLDESQESAWTFARH